MVCTLVVVWCSYVAGTWASARGRISSCPTRCWPTIWPVAKNCSCDPMWSWWPAATLVSWLPRREALYAELIEVMRKVNPRAVIGCHLQPRALLPASLDKLVDVLMYQSGHHAEEQSLGWRLAQYYSSCPPPRPTIDMEPCYEGHALRGPNASLPAEDVRRVSVAECCSGSHGRRRLCRSWRVVMAPHGQYLHQPAVLRGAGRLA